MDGFHLTRAQLSLLDCSADAHARRGVFWTYNAQGVQDLVKALYDSRYDLERIHYAPSFDHVTKDPMYNAIKIDSKVRLLILEGNWLLYDHQPWSTISTMMDDTWFVDVNEELALHRVATRHIESGIETTWSDAMHRATMNDMVNGYLVRSRLVAPKICVQSIEQVC